MGRKSLSPVKIVRYGRPKIYVMLIWPKQQMKNTEEKLAIYTKLREYVPDHEATAYRDTYDKTNTWHRVDKAFILNFLAEKYSCKSYLEIGCRSNTTFSRVRVPQKVGVDPVSGGTFKGTSDSFFEKNQQKFDLIFVDGLHEHKQVLRDVKNGLSVLTANGTIVLHDCLPKNERSAEYPHRTTSTWNGTVYRALSELRTDPELDVITLDTDWGLGVVKKRPSKNPLASLPSNPLTFVDYNANKHNIMGIISSLDEFLDWLNES